MYKRNEIAGGLYSINLTRFDPISKNTYVRHILKHMLYGTTTWYTAVVLPRRDGHTAFDKYNQNYGIYILASSCTHECLISTRGFGALITACLELMIVIGFRSFPGRVLRIRSV